MSKERAAAEAQLTKPIIKSAFALLREKLPATLYYHTPEHSEDVLLEAMCFALEDGLDSRSLDLLAIGAAYHDTGFIEGAIENEALGASLAAQAMEQFGGFEKSEIDLVRRMILETALKKTPQGVCQVPTTVLSRYLCDADVSNLGREDFFDKGELLRREIGLPPADFMAMALKFLSCHQWHTPAGKRLRQERRDANYAELRRRIAQGAN